MSTLPKTMQFIGRILVASLFLLSGIGKITNPEMFSAMMEGAGLPMVSVLLPLTILLEVGGAIVLIIGKRFAALTAVVLAVFTVAANILFHPFWAVDPAMSQIQLSLFLKNIAVLGALLYIAATLYRQRKDAEL